MRKKQAHIADRYTDAQSSMVYADRLKYLYFLLRAVVNYHRSPIDCSRLWPL
ncbi:hypothetical protein CAJAP_08776 [Camponotus japonicus]